MFVVNVGWVYPPSVQHKKYLSPYLLYCKRCDQCHGSSWGKGTFINFKTFWFQKHWSSKKWGMKPKAELCSFRLPSHMICPLARLFTNLLHTHFWAWGALQDQALQEVDLQIQIRFLAVYPGPATCFSVLSFLVYKIGRIRMAPTWNGCHENSLS